MMYDIQKVERTPEGVPTLRTDMVTSSGRRMYDRVLELNRRGQQCRVMPQYGRRTLSHEEIHAFR